MQVTYPFQTMKSGDETLLVYDDGNLVTPFAKLHKDRIQLGETICKAASLGIATEPLPDPRFEWLIARGHFSYIRRSQHTSPDPYYPWTAFSEYTGRWTDFRTVKEAVEHAYKNTFANHKGDQNADSES